MTYEENAAAVFMTVKAMNLHFNKNNTSYDFSKYNGRIKTGKVDKRVPGFWSYAKFGEGKTLHEVQRGLYLVMRNGGFSYINQKTFPFIYKRTISELFSFRGLIEKVVKELSRLDVEGCKQEGELHPKIFDMYQEGVITVETLLIFDRYIDKVLLTEKSRDIVSWPNEIKKLERIGKVFFITLNHEEIEMITEVTKKKGQCV